MDSLIDRLREAKTLADADPILVKLGAIAPIRKLVEASILQRMNPNPASYEYGVSMLNEAIQYLDKEEEPATPESPGIKPKGDHFVKEEELSNNNTSHSAGSEQSTENTEPYSGEGKKTGDEDMINAPDTENQMSEMVPDMNGLHPDIAKQMGSNMPKIPPMNPADQMKQTRYTINQYHETVFKPLLAHSKKQDTAIKLLSQKIREIEAKSGSYTLDMDVIKSNAPARLQETVSNADPLSHIATTRIQNKDFELNQTRNEIRLLNNQMSNV